MIDVPPASPLDAAVRQLTEQTEAVERIPVDGRTWFVGGVRYGIDANSDYVKQIRRSVRDVGTATLDALGQVTSAGETQLQRRAPIIGAGPVLVRMDNHFEALYRAMQSNVDICLTSERIAADLLRVHAAVWRLLDCCGAPAAMRPMQGYIASLCIAFQRQENDAERYLYRLIEKDLRCNPNLAPYLTQVILGMRNVGGALRLPFEFTPPTKTWVGWREWPDDVLARRLVAAAKRRRKDDQSGEIEQSWRRVDKEPDCFADLHQLALLARPVTIPKTTLALAFVQAAPAAIADHVYTEVGLSKAARKALAAMFRGEPGQSVKNPTAYREITRKRTQIGAVLDRVVSDV